MRKFAIQCIYIKFDKSNYFRNICKNILNSMIFMIKINFLIIYRKKTNIYYLNENLINVHYFMVRNNALIEFNTKVITRLFTKEKIIIYGDSLVEYKKKLWFESRPVYSPIFYRNCDYIGDVLISNFKIKNFNELFNIFLDKKTIKIKVDNLLAKRKSKILDDFGIPILIDTESNFNFKIKDKKIKKTNKLSVIIPTKFVSNDIFGINSTISSLLTVQDNFELEFNLVFHVNDRIKFTHLEKQFNFLKINSIQYSKQFNFSEAINLGMQQSNSQLNLLLNDDVNLLRISNLKHLVNHYDDSSTGAIGIRLINQDNIFTHAGIEYRGTRPNHFLNGSQFKYLEKSHAYCREMSGVTGAFILISKKNFDLAGKMNPDFPNDYNDVDLMLNLQKLGLSNLICSQVVGYHAESFTRGKTDLEVIENDLERLTLIHGLLPERDPYLYTPATRLTKKEFINY